MSNRKKKKYTNVYLYDSNNEKILLGGIRINTDLPERAQVKQGVEGMTDLMNSYYKVKIIEAFEKLKAENEQLKAENEKLKARVNNNDVR